MIALHERAGMGQGSGRSVPGFALHEALRACGDGLASHGGHAAAVGFKIPQHLVDEFRERFCDYVAAHGAGAAAVPRLAIDGEIPLSTLTPGLLENLGRIEPCGAGNPRPLFLAGPVQVLGCPRRVGKSERHLKFRVRQQQTSLSAIAFHFADRVEELMSAGGACCLAFTPTFNIWQGWRSVQLEIADFQPGTQARLG
jgi:single-stranded-DNA-specific exonuclease